ncbi:hypothetical protein PSA77_01080 [Pseudomonas aeruginosa]|nr:hypothetical protein PSA77_01074 [Pseudomonas aeruginosa]OWW42814.1 hypothetical protein PSA77_01076 [Pseudomonas aeruginosa]OWW42816.1 hypothetical protein PSA77_01078 [Pseudomonas aeruginosa]OWW42818.1 hypothetical protein PSA77_01080 [Pseudomonas aeruginosa]
MLDRTAIFRSAHSPFGRAWPNVIPSTLCEARVITTAAQACQNSPQSRGCQHSPAQPSTSSQPSAPPYRLVPRPARPRRQPQVRGQELPDRTHRARRTPYRPRTRYPGACLAGCCNGIHTTGHHDTRSPCACDSSAPGTHHVTTDRTASDTPPAASVRHRSAPSWAHQAPEACASPDTHRQSRDAPDRHQERPQRPQAQRSTKKPQERIGQAHASPYDAHRRHSQDNR